ncbi:MAG: glucokinase [Bacteroidetes bacterium]|nr:glucokinase [Bacteroidota bacterium]
MTNDLQVPLSFSRESQVPEQGLKIIAADVGGTKTNMALFEATKTDVKLLKETSYHSSQYHSFPEMILQFMNEFKLNTPDRICAGVAGPVVHGSVSITNLPEQMSLQEIRNATGVQDVSLLNDLEITAYGLAALHKEDVITLQDGDASLKGNIAINAPGTGLGQCGIFWDGNLYHPFPTEGGHCDFSPRTELDFQLFHFFQNKYGIVSWERLIGGPGIHDIYLFLKELRNHQEPEWLRQALQEKDPSAVISNAAVENKDAVCTEVMEHYVRYLARESSNLVLKMKATGGLFLGGGIPPKIAPLLQREIFLKNYYDCDRMGSLLRDVPIKVIMKEKTALWGAAYYGAYGAAMN